MIRRREFIAGIGGAVAWPVAALAQQVVPVIGYLSVATGLERSGSSLAALRQGLSEQGYVVDRNLAIEYRFSGSQYDQLPKLAADLVGRKVAVIVVLGTSSALAAKDATARIPIVGLFGTDPVDIGVLSSLNRPTGNITGIYYLAQALTAKRFELLHEIAPSARSIGLLANPTGPVTEAEKRDAGTAARVLGVQLVILDASTPAEIEVSFAKFVGQRIGALVVGSDGLFQNQAHQVAALAARHSIPAIYTYRDDVEAGGLMSYGVSDSGAIRAAGTYVGRILKGEKPVDLPVQTVTKLKLSVNLKTAKALGLTIPANLLAVADEVIDRTAGVHCRARGRGGMAPGGTSAAAHADGRAPQRRFD
jgi:putative tryptophan/tyrosine transport system substrate-binding protein